MWSYLKSFLLGLVGVVATFTLQYAQETDFGPTWTPLLAAGIPVLVNYLWKAAESLIGKTIANRIIQAMLAALLLTSIAAAEDIRIVGPSAVPAAGYPCDIYVQGELPEGTRIAWDYFPKRDGIPLVEAKDGGRIARLNTMAGDYKLIVAITPPSSDPVIRYHDFHVPGSPYVPPTPVPPSPPAPLPVPTPPEPTPQPQPAPEPALPQGQFGMAQATYDLVRQVESSNRRSEILCLAGKVSQLSLDIQEKRLTNPQAVVNAIGEAFSSCLPAAWDTARERFTARVIELYTAGRLSTLAHWKTLAEESLQGLNAAAK